MAKIIRYSFLTSTLAYSMAAILLFIFSIAQTGWSRIDSNTVNILLSGLTLGLSEFQWWGDVYYLTFLIPWLAASLVMVLLMLWLNKGAGQRRLLGGFSIFAYYLAMFLVFLINGLIRGWGDIGYLFLPVWMIAGFILGYLAVVIIEKTETHQVTD